MVLRRKNDQLIPRPLQILSCDSQFVDICFLYKLVIFDFRSFEIEYFHSNFYYLFYNMNTLLQNPFLLLWIEIRAHDFPLIIYNYFYTCNFPTLIPGLEGYRRLRDFTHSYRIHESHSPEVLYILTNVVQYLVGL